MATFYLFSIILLFLLALFDLYFGVSKDVVNFLISAIGSKTGSFKIILFIAAIGVLSGVLISNGMTDIARHGIFQPQQYCFSEIICILTGVMLANVILLFIFNTLELPASTTVGIIFNLLGGTFALALVKTYTSNGTLHFGNLINTEQSLPIIIGLFLFAAIAFFLGSMVQYVIRLIFSFNYTKNSKYFIGIFGGLAATAILYFMVFLSFRDSSYLPDDIKRWVQGHLAEISILSFIVLSLFMQVLYWLKVNVFKIIVYLGTFGLAMAFAGNDLMNFIGVPLAGLSALQDFTANGAGSPGTWLMTSLRGSASTPWYLLIAAGLIIAVALYNLSKSSHVSDIAADLSGEEEVEESFGTTPIARSLVRTSSGLSHHIGHLIPKRTGRWVDARFNKEEQILENGATFDLVRTAVNVVLSGVLISFGTSLKLPLSTTIVVFMVAMGSSLSDRGWGRESAVYRITEVLSVIGGWLITAGVAFVLCFLITLFLYYGGVPGTILLVALIVYTMIRNRIPFRAKQRKTESDPYVVQLMNSKDTRMAYDLFRQHTREGEKRFLGFAERCFGQLIEAFLNENLQQLRKQADAIEYKKHQLKKDKRIGTLAMRYLDTNTAIVKGGYYYQSTDLTYEIIKSLERICEPCREHIDNNFNPLADDQKSEFSQVSKEMTLFLNKSIQLIEENNYDSIEDVVLEGNMAINKLMVMKKSYLERIRIQACSARLGMVCLTVIQETQNIGAYTINLLKVNRKFQND